MIRVPVGALGGWKTIGPMYDVAATTLSYHFLATGQVVAADVEIEREAVDLERGRLAQPQVGKVGDQLSVQPEGDAPVALAGVLAFTISS